MEGGIGRNIRFFSTGLFPWIDVNMEYNKEKDAYHMFQLWLKE